MPLKIRDVGIAKRQRARGGRRRQSRDRDEACDSMHHGWISFAWADKKRPRTNRETTRDAAMPAPA
jgi:hypothetical protein